MLIADTNEFHPLTNGPAYAAGHAPDGSPFAVVIMRATYSNTHEDSAYAGSIAQARAAGLMVGHYGYMTAGVDAGAQGSFFGRVVAAHGGLRAGDSIWCDDEEGTGSQEPRAAAFLQAAHAVLNDSPMDEGVYSGSAFYAAHLGVRPVLNGIQSHLWIASYGGSEPNQGENLWQFSDTSTAFPGVAGPCDASIFNGTAADYRAQFTPASAPAAAAVAPPPPIPPVTKENPVALTTLTEWCSTDGNGDGYVDFAVPAGAAVVGAPWADAWDPAESGSYDHPSCTRVVGPKIPAGVVRVQMTGAHPNSRPGYTVHLSYAT